MWSDKKAAAPIHGSAGRESGVARRHPRVGLVLADCLQVGIAVAWETGTSRSHRETVQQESRTAGRQQNRTGGRQGDQRACRKSIRGVETRLLVARFLSLDTLPKPTELGIEPSATQVLGVKLPGRSRPGSGPFDGPKDGSGEIRMEREKMKGNEKSAKPASPQPLGRSQVDDQLGPGCRVQPKRQGPAMNPVEPSHGDTRWLALLRGTA